jgi:hypothetical protein
MSGRRLLPILARIAALVAAAFAAAEVQQNYRFTGVTRGATDVVPEGVRFEVYGAPVVGEWFRDGIRLEAQRLEGSMRSEAGALSLGSAQAVGAARLIAEPTPGVRRIELSSERMELERHQELWELRVPTPFRLDARTEEAAIRIEAAWSEVSIGERPAGVFFGRAGGGVRLRFGRTDAGDGAEILAEAQDLDWQFRGGDPVLRLTGNVRITGEGALAGAVVQGADTATLVLTPAGEPSSLRLEGTGDTIFERPGMFAVSRWQVLEAVREETGAILFTTDAHYLTAATDARVLVVLPREAVSLEATRISGRLVEGPTDLQLRDAVAEGRAEALHRPIPERPDRTSLSSERLEVERVGARILLRAPRPLHLHVLESVSQTLNETTVEAGEGLVVLEAGAGGAAPVSARLGEGVAIRTHRLLGASPDPLSLLAVTGRRASVDFRTLDRTIVVEEDVRLEAVQVAFAGTVRNVDRASVSFNPLRQPSRIELIGNPGLSELRRVQGAPGVSH